MNNVLVINSNQTKVIIQDFNKDASSKEFEMLDDSHLIYITFQHDSNSNNKNIVKANLGNNAYLEIYNVVTSDESNEINQVINLNEEGSKVEIMNLLLLTKKANLNSKIEIFHNAKHTESNLANYAISKDQATLLLNNNATIKKGCSLSVVHQSTKGLTLSKTAKIKALPNLYIDEYDVIANHACSIGSINKEDLFYLMSRGMTQEEASKIIVMGYVKPILDHINNEETKKEIEQNFEKYLVD